MNFNNFYNEPSAAKKLEELETIPSPAFGTCMTTILMCKLGNPHGISDFAQPYLDRMLSRVSDVRWKYYLDEIFLNESNILIKLLNDKPYRRWKALINEYKLNPQASPQSNQDKISAAPATRIERGAF